MRSTDCSVFAAHGSALGKHIKPLLLSCALLMPPAALAQTAIVSGLPSSCQTIQGQGAITHWTQLSGNAIVNSREYGNRLVDVTYFGAIFDYPGTALNAWPGTYDMYAGIHLPTSTYLSAAFAIPTGLDMASLQGQYGIDASALAAPVSMSISYTCGDFGQMVPTSIVPNCLLNAATGGALSWQGAANDQACVLRPGYVYYLNVINADISQLASTGVAVSTANAACVGAVCLDPIINGPGNWGVADDIFYSPFE